LVGVDGSPKYSRNRACAPARSEKDDSPFYQNALSPQLAGPTQILSVDATASANAPAWRFRLGMSGATEVDPYILTHQEVGFDWFNDS
jgi:hypothetical protein